MRALSVQLSLLNHHVGAQVELKEVDLFCLELIATHAPLTPSALSRRSGLHPATMTGILDRLEKGGWIARERDPADRRAVLLRPLRERNAELYRLYGGMNASIDAICGDYQDAELQLLADFLRRTAAAGDEARGDLTRD